MFSQAEKDVGDRSNWAGCQTLRSEVRDGLTLDGVLPVVQGEDNLGDMLESLGRRGRGEEGVRDKEGKVLEWTELNCPLMTGALGVLT